VFSFNACKAQAKLQLELGQLRELSNCGEIETGEIAISPVLLESMSAVRQLSARGHGFLDKANKWRGAGADFRGMPRDTSSAVASFGHNPSPQPVTRLARFSSETAFGTSRALAAPESERRKRVKENEIALHSYHVYM